MNDQEQIQAWINQAVIKSGFEKAPAGEIYFKERESDKLVVDMTAGTSVYFKVGKQRVDTDDEAGTLSKTRQMIEDAKDGIMPTKSEPDIVYTRENQAEPHESDKKMVVSDLVHTTPVIYQPKGRMIKDISPGLKEVGKIKIGRKSSKTTGSGHRLPEKFDHFEVTTVHKDEHGDFIPDAAVMGLIGNDAKEIDVSLLYNDPTLNFMTRYAQYKGGKCMCSGDGVEATDSEGIIKPCNPASCPVFATKKCKPNGILSVILKHTPRLGGVYKFRTTSYNSIRSILSSMFFIQSLTGGILAQIPLKMTVSPQSVNPVGSPTAQTIYVVNLEYPGTIEDLHKTTVELMKQRSNMHTQIAELEKQARLALDMPETSEEIEDVEAEFYPENQDVHS